MKRTEIKVGQKVILNRRCVDVSIPERFIGHQCTVTRTPSDRYGLYVWDVDRPNEWFVYPECIDLEESYLLESKD